jgi:hypothetical protein
VGRHPSSACSTHGLGTANTKGRCVAGTCCDAPTNNTDSTSDDDAVTLPLDTDYGPDTVDSSRYQCESLKKKRKKRKNSPKSKHEQSCPATLIEVYVVLYYSSKFRNTTFCHGSRNYFCVPSG